MRRNIYTTEEPMRLYPMNLQLFATSQKDEDGGDDPDSDDDDDPDDDDADDDDPDDDPDARKGGSDGKKRAGDKGAKKKTYTEDEVNKLVEKRLARERRKMARQKDAEDDAGKGGKNSAADAKTKEAVSKAEKLEIKLACYEAGVSKDAVDDVAALARAYMDADEELDFEDAIEKVVKKYPQFTKAKKSADDEDDEDDGDDDKNSGNRSKAWSARQKGTKGTKLSGVERQFYELNPALRPKD